MSDDDEAILTAAAAAIVVEVAAQEIRLVRLVRLRNDRKITTPAHLYAAFAA